MVSISSERTKHRFHTTSVRSEITLDNGPGRRRIGLIVLSNDYTVERDFMNMRPSDEVAVFASRIANTADCTVSALQAMAPRITAAAQLLVPDGRLDAIAYACTSGTVVIGYETVRDRIHAARPAVPCVTPMTASLAALDRFGARKLAVLTPYIDDVNEMIADHLTQKGNEIASFSSFRIEDNEEMAALTGAAIFRAALKADRSDADALFISCTAIRAVDVVEQIEQELGKPVVTANQAMFWQALRATGCNAQVQGYGKLLRLA